MIVSQIFKLRKITFGDVKFAKIKEFLEVPINEVNLNRFEVNDNLIFNCPNYISIANLIARNFSGPFNFIVNTNYIKLAYFNCNVNFSKILLSNDENDPFIFNTAASKIVYESTIIPFLKLLKL